MSTMYDAAKEERKEQVEGAARKVNVDEDYDDDGEDEKKVLLPAVGGGIGPGMGGSGQTSPMGMVGGGGSLPGQMKAESVTA
jgi:hypothetical protein